VKVLGLRLSPKGPKAHFSKVLGLFWAFAKPRKYPMKIMHLGTYGPFKEREK
jgi:hypothetical protein